LQQQKLDQLPILNNWFNRPANTLVFTCGLVMAAHNSWGSEQCLRWQRLISLYLKQPLNDVQKHTHQYAVSHAQMQRHNDLWLPAQALLWPWDTQRLRLPAVQAAAPTGEDLLQWRTLCAELLHSPSLFTNTVQITQRISQALQACGMRRICIMSLDRQAQHAQISHLHGIKADTLLKTFTLDSNAVLTHLLKQPTHLLITDKNAVQVKQHLPAELLKLFPHTHWVIASVSNGSRVVMLIAADQSAENLHPITLQGFKKTLECIERALLIFSSRKG
jgi:hypothetical protein